MKKARCFISYCSEDARSEAVDAIVKHLCSLAKRNEYNVEFLFDKNLSVGNDLNVFMDEIKNVDSVIVICTPKYKERYQNEDNKFANSGVYKECQLIKERLKKKRELLENNKDYEDYDIGVFPLVLKVEGEKSSNSVPDFLENMVREKINEISFCHSKKGLVLNKESKKLYREIFFDCIISTCIIHAKKSEYLDMNFEDKLEKFVYNQKAEYAPNLKKDLFVNTYFFEQIKTQGAYILVGRKGSGKTTTKQYFHSANEDKYKGVIELKIDELNLVNIYNYLFHSPYDANVVMKSDFEEIFTFEKVIEYIWVVYIHIYSMYVVSCEYKNRNNKLTTSQKREFKKVVAFISRVLDKIDENDRWKNKHNISSTIYTYAMSNVYNFFNSVIENSRDDEKFFSSDIQAQLTHENLVNNVLGKELVESFLKGLGECKKRILFTLDGFDSASDTFRRNSLSDNVSEQQKKALFEIRWIASLMELILEIKANTNNYLYRLLDVCFLLPKDLFMELIDKNRDKYKYSNKFCEINWTGMELAIMIRKRLEVLSNEPLSNKEKQQKTVEEILQMVLEKNYKILPKTIEIKTDSRKYNIDLFLYMLRYSFWRPRDLLLALSLILKLVYGHNKTGLPITQETIKYIFKTASVSIVNSEFFNEFGTMWKTIRENIYQFSGKTLVLSEEELKKIILSNHFSIKLESEDNEIKGFKEKVKFLYEIGFLGIFVTKKYSQNYQMVTMQGFAFSEGMGCLNGFLSDDFDGCKFIINPTFIQELNLTINTEQYIGISNWDDLRELEQRVQIKMITDCFGGVDKY